MTAPHETKEPVLVAGWSKASRASVRSRQHQMYAAAALGRAVLFNGVAYSPETGQFTWQETRGKAVAGASAGTTRPDGYVSVTIKQKRYRAHRLAWFLVHGEFPIDMLDHINGDRSDNRIANLRIVTPSQNAINRAPHPRKGVHLSPDGRTFYVRITLHRQNHYVGSYHSLEEAEAAYWKAAERLHGDYVRAAS